MKTLFPCNVILNFQELCALHCPAGGAADRIVGKSDKFPVKNSIRTKTSDRNAHAAFIVYIEADLRAVILLEILNEGSRCTRQAKLLRKAPEVPELCNQLISGWLLAEPDDTGSARMNILR